MFKVTLIFALFTFPGCRHSDDIDAFEQQLNKDTEARIDAAYDSITRRCDSLMTYSVPLNVDSILKIDSVK